MFIKSRIFWGRIEKVLFIKFAFRFYGLKVARSFSFSPCLTLPSVTFHVSPSSSWTWSTCRFSHRGYEICLVFYHTLFLFLFYLPSVDIKNNVRKDSTLLFLFSSWKSAWPCDFPPKTPQVAWSVIPVNWIILHWYACGADGRSNVRSCDTKISRMDIFRLLYIMLLLPY